MAQAAVSLFVVVAIAVIVESNGQSPRRCPANSSFVECPQRLSCRPSCDNPLGTNVCTLECDLANPCVCNPGYLNNNGRCVRPSQCLNGAPKCPANSTYNECPLRKSCRPSCNNPNGTPSCTRECDIANPCVCNSGYLLNSQGKCVSKC